MKKIIAYGSALLLVLVSVEAQANWGTRTIRKRNNQRIASRRPAYTGLAQRIGNFLTKQLTQHTRQVSAQRIAQQETHAYKRLAAINAKRPTRRATAALFDYQMYQMRLSGNPHTDGIEVNYSYARYKLDKESQKVQLQLEQLRYEDTSDASVEITKRYDKLRETENKRHSDRKLDIMKRHIELEDPKAQNEYAPEWDRHMDTMDRINRAELAERTRLQNAATTPQAAQEKPVQDVQSLQAQLVQDLKAAQGDPALIEQAKTRYFSAREEMEELKNPLDPLDAESILDRIESIEQEIEEIVKSL